MGRWLAHRGPAHSKCHHRRPSYRNAANAIHRTVSHRPDRSAHLLTFGEEEREYALAVSFAGCHKYTHWSNGNSHRPQSMLHLALCWVYHRQTVSNPIFGVGDGDNSGRATTFQTTKATLLGFSVSASSITLKLRQICYSESPALFLNRPEGLGLACQRLNRSAESTDSICEQPMKRGVYTCESVARKLEGENPAAGCSPTDQFAVGASRYCAYNQTRERFLCVDVESADFSPASLDVRLPALTPSCGAALWIDPFRGISPTSVRVPIDLIYLDQSFVVLDAIESFPISHALPSSAPAASVLALPARTISSTKTHRGDQLILCTPEELKRHFLQTPGTEVDTQAEQSFSSGPGAASRMDQPSHKASGKGLHRVDHSHPRPSNEDPPTEARPIAAPLPSEPDSVQPAKKKATAPRNWLQRLLSAEPPDPRNAPRESLSWLAAYFFTGGTPVAHGIREISSTGLYIFTEERWYLGTVIRITLTDRLEPTAERSFTVNAKVVRWGNDGVGLQFVLKDKKDLRHGKDSAAGNFVEDIGRIQVEQFLQRVRSRTS